MNSGIDVAVGGEGVGTAFITLMAAKHDLIEFQSHNHRVTAIETSTTALAAMATTYSSPLLQRVMRYSSRAGSFFPLLKIFFKSFSAHTLICSSVIDSIKSESGGGTFVGMTSSLA